MRTVLDRRMVPPPPPVTVNRAAIEAVWAAVPDVACKGLCADSCGPIGASPAERTLLAERGVNLRPFNDSLADMLMGRTIQSCPALVDGRCSVYEVRPTICRLWGAVEGMPCPHGCEPADGRLPDTQGAHLLARANSVGQLLPRRMRRR